jgi:hypothetical protein
MDGLFVEFHPQKRGRPRKFKPADLLDEFQNYIQDRMSNPIVEKEEESGYAGQNSSAKTKEKSHPQLLSVADFCVFLGCSRNWWNELPDEYLGVKSHISTYIDNFQLKGASIGVFNANIVSRLLGLKDKTEFSGGGIILRIETDQETKELIEGGLG